MKQQYKYNNPGSFAVIILITTLPILLAFIMQRKPDDFKLPIIINKGNKTSSCLTPYYMMNAWYDLERLEKIRDTLDLGLKQDRKKMNEHFFEFYEDPKTGHSNYSNDGLVVVVDTVQELTMLKQPIWASYLFHRSFNKSLVLQDDTLSQYVKSFPIYIANTSAINTAILRTQDGSAIMITEAMDKHGKWNPIEYWSNSWCGNSYFSMTIPPGHFAFTRGIKCSGDTKRLCRLKLSNDKTTIYSNTFYMLITESQFTKPSGAK